jgi:hypothetical protein
MDRAIGEVSFSFFDSSKGRCRSEAPNKLIVLRKDTSSKSKQHLSESIRILILSRVIQYFFYGLAGNESSKYEYDVVNPGEKQCINMHF